MGMPLTELCFKLSHDRDAGVKIIGQRCLRAYDEFVGLRYAGLTVRDVAYLTAAAAAATGRGDAARADILDAAVIAANAALTS